MKLRFLMSPTRKNSVRDKVTERSGFIQIQREAHSTDTSVGHRRGWVQPWNVAWLVFRGWVISYANKWEGYYNYFWEGVEISRIRAASHSLVFWQCLGTGMAPLGVSLHLLTEDQGLVWSATLVPFDSNWFMLWASLIAQLINHLPAM